MMDFWGTSEDENENVIKHNVGDKEQKDKNAQNENTSNYERRVRLQSFTPCNGFFKRAFLLALHISNDSHGRVKNLIGSKIMSQNRILL